MSLFVANENTKQGLFQGPLCASANSQKNKKANKSSPRAQVFRLIINVPIKTASLSSRSNTREQLPKGRLPKFETHTLNKTLTT
jgi:hypothetical protein